MQHTRVEDGHLIVFWQAHRLGQPQRQQRGAQPMLERLTHGQIGRQRQHPGRLGQPQRVGDPPHPDRSRTLAAPAGLTGVSPDTSATVIA
jgi:hypothetical protein